MRALLEPHLAQERAGPVEGIGLAAQLERHRDVFERGQGRDEVKGLEDVPDGVAAEAGQAIFAEGHQVHAVDDDVARGGAIEPRDETEQRGLAAARRARDGDELTRRDLEPDIGENIYGPAAALEAHAEAADADHDASHTTHPADRLQVEPAAARGEL
mgnify:CR=1 FL=1